MKLRFYKVEKVIENVRKLLEDNETGAYTLMELVDDKGNTIYELAVAVLEGRRGKYTAFVVKGLPSGRDYIIFTSDIEELINFFKMLADSEKALDRIAKAREELEELRQRRKKIETVKVKEAEEEETVEAEGESESEEER